MTSIINFFKSTNHLSIFNVIIIFSFKPKYCHIMTTVCLLTAQIQHTCNIYLYINNLLKEILIIFLSQTVWSFCIYDHKWQLHRLKATKPCVYSVNVQLPAHFTKHKIIWRGAFVHYHLWSSSETCDLCCVSLHCSVVAKHWLQAKFAGWKRGDLRLDFWPAITW